MRAYQFPFDMGCRAPKSIPPRFSVLVAALLFVDPAWSLLALVFLESLGLQAHVVVLVQMTWSCSPLSLLPF